MDYNMRFLAVDDMDSMRRIMSKNLNQMGFKNVVTASNGAEALRILQTQTIHAVITDWNMPGMTGLDLTKAIRADAKLAKLPILMVTAEADRHQIELAIESGVSDFLVKPYSVNRLEEKLNNIFDKPKPMFAQARAATLSPVAGKTAKPVTNVVTSSGNAEPPAVVLNDDFKKMPHKANLLVVDDVPENLDVLVELLEDEYRVNVANSGERALEILGSGKIPDLVLLDVIMPKMDGFEVCRRIKANSATADVPVIFLTAMNDATDLVHGFEVGAVDFVTKPSDPLILKARISTHIKLKRLLEETRRNHQELLKNHAALEEHTRLREEVDRIARHDMKNPIGGIINFSSMLLDDDMITRDQKSIIKDIEQSAYSVLNMVNLSFDLYRMEQGTYEFNPCKIDVVQILNRIVKEKKSELDTRKITVQFMVNSKVVKEHEAFEALGDELLCYSMFSNLFKNAVEASGAKHTIKIDLHVVDDLAMISIVNHGTVPKEIRDRFFEKFVTAGKPGGTGIGTYSAKLIAETQRGMISMNTSDENSTTTVSVMLPRPQVANDTQPEK